MVSPQQKEKEKEMVQKLNVPVRQNALNTKQANKGKGLTVFQQWAYYPLYYSVGTKMYTRSNHKRKW